MLWPPLEGKLGKVPTRSDYEVPFPEMTGHRCFSPWSREEKSKLLSALQASDPPPPEGKRAELAPKPSMRGFIYHLGHSRHPKVFIWPGVCPILSQAGGSVDERGLGSRRLRSWAWIPLMAKLCPMPSPGCLSKSCRWALRTIEENLDKTIQMHSFHWGKQKVTLQSPQEAGRTRVFPVQTRERSRVSQRVGSSRVVSTWSWFQETRHTCGGSGSWDDTLTMLSLK